MIEDEDVLKDAEHRNKHGRLPPEPTCICTCCGPVWVSIVSIMYFLIFLFAGCGLTYYGIKDSRVSDAVVGIILTVTSLYALYINFRVACTPDESNYQSAYKVSFLFGALLIVFGAFVVFMNISEGDWPNAGSAFGWLVMSGVLLVLFGYTYRAHYKYLAAANVLRKDYQWSPFFFYDTK